MKYSELRLKFQAYDRWWDKRSNIVLILVLLISGWHFKWSDGWAFVSSILVTLMVIEWLTTHLKTFKDFIVLASRGGVILGWIVLAIGILWGVSTVLYFVVKLLRED